MNSEKMRQIREFQWKEGMNFVTFSIFQGTWPYKRFLATNPTPEEKKYVDDWIKAHLALPKYKDKIIPGFNDK